MVDELNMKNNLLQSNIDELNQEVLKQTQLLTGLERAQAFTDHSKRLNVKYLQ